MLGEFKCDEQIFVHLFRKKLLFEINDSTEFLSTHLRTFLANLFQNNLHKSHARRSVIILGVKFVIFSKIETFQILNLL